MNIFRITGENHAFDLSGTGARMYGGRWNPKGFAVLYVTDIGHVGIREMGQELQHDLRWRNITPVPLSNMAGLAMFSFIRSSL